MLTIANKVTNRKPVYQIDLLYAPETTNNHYCREENLIDSYICIILYI